MNETIMAFLPMIIALVIIYFLMIRPQRKREQEVQEMRSALKVGDEVLTVGGIKGEITRAGEDYIVIQTGNKTKIEFTRNAVYRVLSDEEESDSQDENQAENQVQEEVSSESKEA